jgi:hypothetical protein
VDVWREWECEWRCERRCEWRCEWRSVCRCEQWCEWRCAWRSVCRCERRCEWRCERRCGPRVAVGPEQLRVERPADVGQPAAVAAAHAEHLRAGRCGVFAVGVWE